MKLPTIAFLFLAIAPSLQAQSLDIGGIEIKIGQSQEGALAQLGAVYDVKVADISNDNSFRKWYVSERSGNRSWLGSLNVQGGAVVGVEKRFDVSDERELGAVYERADNEIRRRSGGKCVGPKFDYNHFLTDCGKYSLTLHLSRTVEGIRSNPPQLVETAIKMYLR